QRDLPHRRHDPQPPAARPAPVHGGQQVLVNRAQSTGIILMAGAVLQFVLFLIGVTRRSYLAMALPVTAAMTALTAITFWVGWTMVSMEDEDEAPTDPSTDA